MEFTQQDLLKLWQPRPDSAGEDNGQVTIIGGSQLFSGAPLLSVVAASRLVDMAFLATPEEDRNIVNKVKVFSRLRSVIWVPREDLDEYVTKSDAVLIGPGLMRFHRESASRPDGQGAIYDQAGTETKMLTRYLLHKFSAGKWVIDGGSLQTMEASWIPKNAVLTPNIKEFEILVNTSPLAPFLRKKRGIEEVRNLFAVFARKYNCILVGKGPTAVVTDGETTYEIDGGNAGLTKGGTGDVLAGVIVGFLAKNPPLLAAAAGTYLVKKAAEYLYTQVGYHFNADDLSENVFGVYRRLL